MASRLTALAALGAFALLGACGGDKTPPPDTSSPAAAAPPPMPATPALSDANIAALLDQTNVADSSYGAVASTKATNAEVKAFAKRMMMDHHMLRQKGLDLAKSLNVTPEPPAGSTLEADAKAWVDSLNAMPKGAAWDKAYMDKEVAGHENALRTIDDALAATQTPQLRALLEEAKPAVQAHLDMAKALQTKLGSGTP
jgi:putative membrane protein